MGGIQHISHRLLILDPKIFMSHECWRVRTFSPFSRLDIILLPANIATSTTVAARVQYENTSLFQRAGRFALCGGRLSDGAIVFVQTRK